MRRLHRVFRRAFYAFMIPAICLPGIAWGYPIYFTIENAIFNPSPGDGWRDAWKPGGEKHVVMVDMERPGSTRDASGNTIMYSHYPQYFGGGPDPGQVDYYFADYLSGPALRRALDGSENNYAGTNDIAEGPMGFINVGAEFHLESFENYFGPDVSCVWDPYIDCVGYQAVQDWDVGSLLAAPDPYGEWVPPGYIISEASKNSPVPIPASIIHLLLGMSAIVGLNHRLVRERKDGAASAKG